GCFGFGDCASVCPNQAICIENGIAHVRSQACIGCGLCAKTCPQHVIDLVSDKTKAVVLCRNTDKGVETRKACSRGCIGCKKCEKNCPSGAIKVENNLAAIDQSLCVDCGQCASGCPTHAITFADFSGAHRVRKD
ncbi:MAG: 4Fe-4S binding protein, partial [Clostridia bacterium]|nr:4Fe-4S binding protein [Clostridia bacterium]